MKVLLSLACFIIPLISLEADKCKEREEYIIFLASANEIDVRACPLNPNENKGTIIWYKNDSTTPISTAQDDRIHQQKNKLWFVPAKVEDSGHYYCVVRNSTYCLKIKITTSILENEPDLCYNSQVIFTQRLHIAEDGKLVCPHLDFFKDENEELPQVQWYKDCKPLLLDNSLFIGVKNQLIVKNVSEYHRGHYTCLVSYTYLGKQYNITRVIEFFTLEEIKPHRPVILSPVNETKEVNLGSHVQLICNATGKSSDIVSWKWNGSEIFFIDDPVLEEDYQFVENPSDKIKNTLITILNISEVKSQFYLYPFICVARNTDKISEAYIQFVYPVPDFKNHIIGIFVPLTVMIVCSVFIYKIFKVDIVLWYRDSWSHFLHTEASDEKSYDAYILYPKTFTEGSTSNSDMFVFKILPEVLENQFGYRLFIYGRDDYVGEDTIEVTNENIKKSRRLIIVLVRDVSGFSWLDHSSEEQIVMYNALIEDGIKIVLLELEKIEDYEKMPESIRFIKQKHGTIRWSGDLREGPQSSKSRFWKKVRYHMPAQRRLPSSKQQLLSLTSGSGTKASLQSEVHLPLG
ncbi:PREDICTED: interleukin-1 receptor type 1 isoform X1 [Dipodomys ordii]|uniref:Interleukin-1 receptor type 1 n=1 Tax=Dipodomys ordii TaxID=10020 RepID=A0A1S3FH81_DIPOR|nr:PREDICTED: interleukin-1 receptor type 1 isoform X1 [Dipodomys ordii]XP_012875278.1 PREDICTED: interleukin-1 receptor type 1 isoform X1 [Dipodomys ordii]